MVPRHGRRHGRPQSGDEPEQVLFVESVPVPGRITRLRGGEADHARRSLRLRTGDPVHLVDGRAGRYRGRIADLGKDTVDVHVEDAERIAEWPGRTLWLGAAVLRSTRMDFIIEKATELGVSRLVPLVLKRCVAHPQKEGTKQERWQRLAVEALKQSKRARLLELTPPQELASFLEGLPEGRTLWVADPSGAAPGQAAERTPEGPLVLVVGPEGGLAPEEKGVLERAGALFVGLGGHRLRAETAVVALTAAALASLGEMGPPRPGGGSGTEGSRG